MRKHKKFLSLLTAALLCVTLTPAAAFGSMPDSASGYGEVWDGIDFDALIAEGSGVYYGNYNHAVIANTSDTVTGWEGFSAPILWSVMGEEAGDGALTLLSKYVLDSQVFNTEYRGGNAQNYADSELHTWLNERFLSDSNFEDAEQNGMAEVNTITGMYDKNTGAPITGDHYPQYAYTDDGSGLEDNDTNQQVNTGPWPKNTAGDKVYLPWDKVVGNTVYWTAGNDVSEGLLSSNFAGNAATLKNGTAVNWWLRSPFSSFSGGVLCVGLSGETSYYGDVFGSFGVRPVFKLKPESVLFASEVLDDVTGRPDATLADGGRKYAAGEGGAKNFKLTVLNPSLTLSFLSDSDGTIMNGSTRQIAGGGSLALTGTGTGTDHGSLAYKIVDRDNGSIAGYGTAASAKDITVDASALAAGDYTVYVWAQKDNTLNSNSGSQPLYFTLTVGGATSAPEDSGPEPARENEPVLTPAPSTGSTNSIAQFSDVQTHWAYDPINFAVANGLFAGTSATAFSPNLPMTRGMIVTVLGRLYGADTSAYASSGFNDVQTGQYYTPYIEWAKEIGIISGIGDNRFAPDATITRQDFAVIITNYAKFAGKQFPVTLQYQTFADESEIAEYAKNAVQTLYGGGIISGKGNNLFDPQGSATRAEVASILHRFIEKSL
jgi:hypothetical protein